jgi:hypothetical protein
VSKVLRRIAIALLLSFLVGLAIGAAISLRLARPTVYVGARGEASPVEALPLHVADPGAPVGHARHHEQEIG